MKKSKRVQIDSAMKEVKLLSKESILSAQDLKTEIIDVPEWGGKVRISEITGIAYDQLMQSSLGKNGETNLINGRSKYIAACIVGENGEPLFTEEDIIDLNKKSSSVLDRVYDLIERLNKSTDDDVVEIAKN